MDGPAVATTLYEDWQRRRWQLSVSRAVPHLASQLKVLDYLLSRYQGTSEANRPARFSLRQSVFWNARRIVVHQHLGRGDVAGVKSVAEANRRVALILQRMASGDRGEEEDFDFGDPADPRLYPVAARLLWKWIIELLRFELPADYYIQCALAECPRLPSIVMDHLCARLSDSSYEDVDAMILFQQSDHKHVAEYAVRAWRERVIGRLPADTILEQLEKYFHLHREAAIDKLRERLADVISDVRLAATELLGQLGDLEDVGLLSDLLSLPAADDENARERPALVGAMNRIAQRGEQRSSPIA